MRLNTYVPYQVFGGLILLLAASFAWGADEITIELLLKDHKYQPAEVKAPAGKPIIIKVQNQDPTPEEFESATLRVEKIIAPQSEITVRIKPLKSGRYPFIGEYHQETAAGVLIVE